MNPTDVWVIALVLLVIAAAIAFGAYRAGWTAATSYLATSVEYGKVVNSLAQTANSYGTSLDTSAATLAALKSAIETSTETLIKGDRATELALLRIFDGLERAGTVRSQTRGVGRQVGEKPRADDDGD